MFVATMTRQRRKRRAHCSLVRASARRECCFRGEPMFRNHWPDETLSVRALVWGRYELGASTSLTRPVTARFKIPMIPNHLAVACAIVTAFTCPLIAISNDSTEQVSVSTLGAGGN